MQQLKIQLDLHLLKLLPHVQSFLHHVHRAFIQTQMVIVFQMLVNLKLQPMERLPANLDLLQMDKEDVLVERILRVRLLLAHLDNI